MRCVHVMSEVNSLCGGGSVSSSPRTTPLSKHLLRVGRRLASYDEP